MSIAQMTETATISLGHKSITDVISAENLRENKMKYTQQISGCCLKEIKKRRDKNPSSD
ncbi:hypothetical protein XNC1_4016 [Xenorhabdus nematophila ATCC 19061]|uniref:Uncharacterized protein n=1 Tax=Xenorhabdus nematophila (strain ATCC 19061 / DSM 3370 / CCUG 14189 / LMG 1036 / NCIMB 9965 / AN6) TaxID=406817 RepID=D3VCK6_XENNA|nr:hypothetical protein XNC1_4016 [Xenorhabdus nematophila ATCC 19061]